MKILIIGGTGNISTPITKSLLAQGHELVLFNYDPLPPDWLKGVQIVTGDRNQRAEFKQKLGALGNFDCIIDMICYEPGDAECDVQTFRGRTQQFIFCSTVDVYSKTPAVFPVTEKNGKIEALPSFPYAYKKMECERIMWEAHRRGDFALTVCRPTFTYNEAWSPGIHSFGGQSYHLDRLRLGKPIIMHGDGTSIWVASYRDDTASGFVGAVDNPKAFGQAYNLAGEEWMTHNHIWRTIARIMGAPAPDFVYIPTELLGKLAPKEAEWCIENFRYNNIFDNSKAKRDLGFRINVKFEDGVRKCIDYLVAHNLIEDCAKHPFYDRLVAIWRRHQADMIKEINIPIVPL
jgi:nucleoside-diphosphate-sugar epimerase